jgi:hypothetical protein
MTPKGEDEIEFAFFQKSRLNELAQIKLENQRQRVNQFSQGGLEMRIYKRILIFIFVAGLLMVEANHLISQEKFSVLAGKVLGIRMRMWLDVESEKDKAIVNFRIGRKTVYIPQRYPYVGEKVKVEYLTQRGVPIAYSVTILEAAKTPQETAPPRSTK